MTNTLVVPHKCAGFSLQNLERLIQNIEMQNSQNSCARLDKEAELEFFPGENTFVDFFKGKMHQLIKTCVTRVSPQRTRGDPIKTGSRKTEKKPGIMTLPYSRFVRRENPAPASSYSSVDVFLRGRHKNAFVRPKLKITPPIATKGSTTCIQFPRFSSLRWGWQRERRSNPSRGGTRYTRVRH